MFTKFFGAGLFMSLTVIGLAANAQTTALNGEQQAAATASNTTPAGMPVVKHEAKAEAKAETTEVKKADDPADSTWKPQRRLWGYAFGDLYYNAHSPGITVPQGKENNYYQVPTYRNAFQFRRVYLGYDYEITKKFKAEVLLSSEPAANTGLSGTTTIENGDNLVDNKMAFFIKNFNLRYRDIWNGTDIVLGELSTPGFALNEPGTNGATSLSEATWGYRSIERTVTDFHRNNSYDLGVSLQGTFDPKTKDYGYVLMVGNNSTSNLLSAANANTGFYKMFYGDLWGKFFDKKLVADIYADYGKTAAATAAIGAQSHNMIKGFVAYTTPKLTIGVEAYTQKITNGVTNTTTKTNEDATVNAISVFVKGAITSKLGYFARYDGYNPDTNFQGADAYSVNTNYGAYDPYTREHFYTFGLDFQPAKNIHFMPNVWFIQYLNNNDNTVKGYVPDNHTLVYRATFYYVFGK
jgi:hypothetical protein